MACAFKILLQYILLNMDCCSRNAYLSFEAEEMDIDTNIVQIDFSVLKGGMVNIHQGDPNRCEKCSSVLNFYSKVLNQDQYYTEFPPMQLEKGQELQEEQISQYPIKLNENEQCWVCEFCGQHNRVIIEPEEIPKQGDVTFMIEPSIQKGLEEGGQSIIFCIDNSGSMSTTSEIKGVVAFKHGTSNEEYELLKQFMEPGDEAQLQNFKNTTYVSRKQCVLAAIETQIDQLKKEQPNKLVGLVTFNDEVVVLGDGTNQPLVIAGDRLNKREDITDLVEPAAQQLLSKSIKYSAEQLSLKFSQIQEKGRTSLGPALLSSVLLAKAGQPGSKVIICTDGLANKGLGNIDEDPSSEAFYMEVADLAKANGVSISVITIKGEGCKLEILGKMAELTAGNVRRVTPENLEKDFSSILKDEVVGTNVKLQVKIHQALRFRGDISEVQGDGTILTRDIGNVTVKSSTTVEYRLKPQKQLEKEGIDARAITKIHIQSILKYDSPSGDRLMRVFTRQIEATFDRQEAQRATNYEIMSRNLIRKTAHMIKTGDTSGARLINAKWNQKLASQEVALDQQNQINTISEQMNKLEIISNNIDQRGGRLEQLKQRVFEIQGGDQQSIQEQFQQEQVQILKEKEELMNEEDDDMGNLFI